MQNTSVFFLQAWFTGTVQGVGFRYQVLRLSYHFEVRGLIKNLPDGRVYLEVEGPKEEVLSFQKTIETQMQKLIQHVETESKMALTQFEEFTIAF